VTPSTRQREILDAALELFGERGFAATGIDAIGARAGIHGPNIYKHFSGKGELLATLIDEAMDRLLALTGGEAPADDPRAELDRLIHGHIAFALSDRRLLAVYAQDARSLSEPDRRRARRRQRRYVARWVDVLDRCHPGHDREELEVAAHGAIGLIQSVIHWPAPLLAHPGVEQLTAARVRSGLAGLAGRAGDGQRPDRPRR
jgi:AcrR family transcriptional regulator